VEAEAKDGENFQLNVRKSEWEKLHSIRVDSMFLVGCDLEFKKLLKVSPCSKLLPTFRQFSRHFCTTPAIMQLNEN
jgi:hypothetical protein